MVSLMMGFPVLAVGFGSTERWKNGPLQGRSRCGLIVNGFLCFGVNVYSEVLLFTLVCCIFYHSFPQP